MVTPPTTMGVKTVTVSVRVTNNVSRQHMVSATRQISPPRFRKISGFRERASLGLGRANHALSSRYIATHRHAARTPEASEYATGQPNGERSPFAISRRRRWRRLASPSPSLMAAGQYWSGGGLWAPHLALDGLFSDDQGFFPGGSSLPPRLPSPPPPFAAALHGYPPQPQDNFDVFHSQDLAHLAAQVAHRAEFQEKLGAGLHPKITPHLAYSNCSILDQPDNSPFSLVTPVPTSQHVSSSVIATSVQGRPTLPPHIDSLNTGSTGVLQILQGSSIPLDRPADDGYNWRKYGQKSVKGGKYPRSYYKCTLNCPVRKNVEHSLDGRIIKIVYRGQHCHERPSKRFKDCGGLLNELDYFSDTEKVSVRSQLDCQGHHGKSITSVGAMADHLSLPTREEGEEQLSGSADSREEVNDEIAAIDGDVGDADANERNAPGQKIIVSTTSVVDLLDDGYRWRKYGQKVVRGNAHPRSYYKCTYQGCDVKKHIERSCKEPNAVITTYEGKHIHDVPV